MYKHLREGQLPSKIIPGSPGPSLAVQHPRATSPAAFGSKSGTGAALPCAYQLLHQNRGQGQEKPPSLSSQLLLQCSVMNKWIKQQSAVSRHIYLSATLRPFNLTANRFIIDHLFPVTPVWHGMLSQRRGEARSTEGSRQQWTGEKYRQYRPQRLVQVLGTVPHSSSASRDWFTVSGNGQKQGEEAVLQHQTGLRVCSGNTCAPAGSPGLHWVIPRWNVSFYGSLEPSPPGLHRSFQFQHRKSNAVFRGFYLEKGKVYQTRKFLLTTISLCDPWQLTWPHCARCPRYKKPLVTLSLPCTCLSTLLISSALRNREGHVESKAAHRNRAVGTTIIGENIYVLNQKKVTQKGSCSSSSHLY